MKLDRDGRPLPEATSGSGGALPSMYNACVSTEVEPRVNALAHTHTHAHTHPHTHTHRYGAYGVPCDGAGCTNPPWRLNSSNYNLERNPLIHNKSQMTTA